MEAGASNYIDNSCLMDLFFFDLICMAGVWIGYRTVIHKTGAVDKNQRPFCSFKLNKTRFRCIIILTIPVGREWSVYAGKKLCRRACL
jgi:hypothetical protein